MDSVDTFERNQSVILPYLLLDSRAYLTESQVKFYTYTDNSSNTFMQIIYWETRVLYPTRRCAWTTHSVKLSHIVVSTAQASSRHRSRDETTQHYLSLGVSSGVLPVLAVHSKSSQQHGITGFSLNLFTYARMLIEKLYRPSRKRIYTRGRFCTKTGCWIYLTSLARQDDTMS